MQIKSAFKGFSDLRAITFVLSNKELFSHHKTLLKLILFHRQNQTVRNINSEAFIFTSILSRRYITKINTTLLDIMKRYLL